MYARGLDLQVLDRFNDHDGFDGVMLGLPGAAYHFEFTVRRSHPMPSTSSPEDLLVFYVPDRRQWERTCARVLAAGFRPVAPVNPYWELRGRTYEDPDGYRVVIERADWSP